MQKMGTSPSLFIILYLYSISIYFKVWIFFLLEIKHKTFYLLMLLFFLLFAVLHWLPLKFSHTALPWAILCWSRGNGDKMESSPFDRYAVAKQDATKKLQHRKSWLAVMEGRNPQSTKPMQSPSLEIRAVALNSRIKGSPVPFWVQGPNQTTFQPKLFQEYN